MAQTVVPQKPVSKDNRSSSFTNYNNLASEKVGAKVIFSTDDWFAVTENLVKDGEPEYREGFYTDCGQWMDGWQTRRKRTEGYNWCIIQLGVPGCIKGLDVDTSFFTGNNAPRCSIQAACLDKVHKGREGSRQGKEATEDDWDLVDTLQSEKWEFIVSLTHLEPGYRSSCHNFFQSRNCSQKFTHIRFNIYPDGGVARLRVYGQAMPNWSAVSNRKLVDLLSARSGGVCLCCSQTDRGEGRNLLQPGRGDNARDGWEVLPRSTRPSVVQRNKQGYLHDPGAEWCVFRLGHPGIIQMVEVDTNHFKGNFPDTCKVEACCVDKHQEDSLLSLTEKSIWKPLLPVQKLKAHNQHMFDAAKGLNLAAAGVVSHVRLTIAPDGGISRFRLWGHKADRPTAKL